jgi:FMN reductase
VSTRTLAVVTAGLSVPSSTRLLSDRLSAATVEALRDKGIDATVEVVEVRELARDLADHMATGFPSERLGEAVGTVEGADGVIAVSPVFTASYSGLFKTFVDVLDKDALAGAPVLVAATAGTERHSLVLDHAMRPLFSYLRAVVVPTAVFAASSDWAGGAEADAALAERVRRAGGELAALVAANPPRRRHDPFASPTSFEDLLRGT